ncbi:MAG: hypothetical protein WKF77_30495 [Planctomycetaceae bacterium]
MQSLLENPVIRDGTLEPNPIWLSLREVGMISGYAIQPLHCS